jgi:hypothetical protein
VQELSSHIPAGPTSEAPTGVSSWKAAQDASNRAVGKEKLLRLS